MTFEQSKPLSLRGQIILFLTIRTVLSVMVRMTHPFLPVFARGLNVDLETIALVLSASYLGGIIGPFIATISDHIGSKTGMIIGLLIFTTGALLVVFFPFLSFFFFSLLLATMGRNIVIPAMVAYIGDQVPYEKRGKVIGIIETSWALAFILCIPLVGVLIENVSWQAPFIGLGIISLALLAAVQFWIPRTKIPRTTYNRHPFAFLKIVLSNRSAVMGLIMGFFVFTGSSSIQIIFGAWLEKSFQLGIAAIGLAATVIGFAQLGGELLSASFVDRIGKKRSVYSGLLVSILVSILIFWFENSLTGALIWLFIFFIGLEYAVICSISMMSEIVPEARASVIAIYYSMVSVGFAIGPAISPILFKMGFSANALASAGLFIIAFFFLYRIKVPQHSSG